MVPTQEWTSFKIDDQVVRANLSLPDTENANGCGVVLIHGSSGLENSFLTFPKRLAELGYAAVMPDMFHRQPNFLEMDLLPRLQSLTWAGAQRDIAGALALLRENGVERAAVLGYCFGGGLALMAPATMDFATAVLYYAHDLFAPFGAGPAVPADSVPQINVPILGHFGAEDKNPSPAHMHRLDEALTAVGVPHEFYAYEGAGHGFAVKNEGRPNFREAQAREANDRTIEWFDRQLRNAGVPA